MAWPSLRWHLALSVWLVVGHRIQSGFRQPGEAAALLEAAQERINMRIELKSCESFRNALRICGLVLKN